MSSSAALVAAVSVAVVVSSCGGGGGKSASSTGAATTGASPPAKQLRVGLMPDVSGLNDRGFNHLAYVGVKDAARRLKVRYRVFLTNADSEYLPNLTTFAQQGYDLTIAVGYTEINALDKAALKFPNRRFAIVDVDQRSLTRRPKNVLGLLFREQEVGYLAGYLAGLEEKRRPGPDVIGSVGGQKQPPIDRFIAGYQAGAKAADPGIKTLNSYANDPTFADQAKCKDVALNEISAGAGVVFQIAGGCGLGVIDAAKERGVWSIGVDADQAYIDPRHVLTSAVKRVDVAVFKAIQSVRNGTFKGGDVVYGLKEGGVGLGKINPRVPKADVAKVEQVRRDIISGKIKNIPTTVK